jgi:TetR/AcrR family transcriptional regulator, repressor for uid operon
MNVHSQNLMSLSQTAELVSSTRRERILDAAERCFVQAGFHRTTMQDVAAEVAMSAGNLYRYFPSKELIVVGLAERDRERIQADFAHVGNADDFLAAFEMLGRKHLIDQPRQKSILALEIWAEATRNKSVNMVCLSVDGEVHDILKSMFTAAGNRGLISPATHLDMAIRLLVTIADGLTKRRALEDDFDGERELGIAMAMLRALFSGAIALPGMSTQQTATGAAGRSR